MLYGRMETEVLIRATLAADERTVRIAPGVEVPSRAVQIATDLPPSPDGMPLACVMFFETEEDRREFAELFADDIGVHVRDL